VVQKKGFDLDGEMLGVDKLLFPELGKYLLFTRLVEVYGQEDYHQQYNTSE
jgi:hypothetical protein